jgi:hypothetical protein
VGYLHINNLSSDTRILEFKHVYALEKIHGTSTHISYSPEERIVVGGDSLTEDKFIGALKFFSGGENYENFVKLFDKEKLEEIFHERFGLLPVTVYGEAYGGKQQGMSATYGKDLRFVVFDVKVGDLWLDVPKRHNVAIGLGLDFVDYELIPTTQEALDAERDKPSTQAIRNGMGNDKMREGIVLCPPFEVRLNNNERLIAKYKRPEFSERRSTSKPLDPEKQAALQNAQSVAFEFVTPMRLEHVINRLISERDDKSYSIKDTGKVIDLMIEDVEREGKGEFEPSQAIRKAIGGMTVQLYKKKLSDNLREQLKVPAVVGMT